MSYLHEEINEEAGLEDAQNAVRRYLETTPIGLNQQDQWNRLAILCNRTKDLSGEAHALVALSEIPEISFGVVSTLANKLNQIFYLKGMELDTDEKQSLFKRLAKVMENRISEADSTDCSRLAWLYLNLKDKQNAKRITQLGFEQDPDNYYINKLTDVLSDIR